MNRSESHGHIVAYAALTLLLFLLLANIQFRGMERLSTGRLAIVLLGLWALVEGKNPFHHLASRVWLPFLPIPCVAVQFVFVGDSDQLSRLLHLALYSYLGAALFVTIARDVKVVLWTLLCAITLQSAMILFSFVSLDYRAWFDTVIYTDSNYDASNLYRAPGLTSGGGASLSLTQSMGVFVAWLLLRTHQPEPATGRVTYVIAGAGLLAAASCVVVGRTGLLMSGLFFALQLVESKERWRLLTLLFVMAMAAWWSAEAFLTDLLGENFSLDFFIAWAFASFVGEDSSVSDLSSMPIPPLSLDTLVGTGLAALINGGNPSGHDSGFVQTYYSMGLIFAVIFFTAYLYMLFYCFRWLPLRWQLMLTFVFFMLETKEPFVFKYTAPFVVLALHFAHQGVQAPNRARIKASPRLA